MMQTKETIEQKNLFFDFVIQNLFLTTSLMLGIIFAYTQMWQLVAGFTALTTLIYMCGIRKKNLFILASLLFAIGFLRLQQKANTHQKTIDQIQQHPLTLLGTIKQIEQAEHKQYRYTMLVQIHAWFEDDSPHHYIYPWCLQCYTKSKPKGSIGDTIQLDKIKINTKAKSSFATYLLREGIHATTFLRWNAQTILNHPAFCLERLLHTIKYNILGNIRKKCSPSTMVLISSIFFGNRLYVKTSYMKLKDTFCNWGIVHFLARSGIHLIIFILFLQSFLQWIPLPFLWKQSILLCLSCLYAALTWQSVSFSRAYFSFIWYKFCHIYGLQINMIHIILMLSCLFLLFNPTLLFFLDFQLSFGITLVLAITNQYISRQKQLVL